MNVAGAAVLPELLTTSARDGQRRHPLEPDIVPAQRRAAGNAKASTAPDQATPPNDRLPALLTDPDLTW
jgi:hypothetical protein